jgi:histidyl-tRNA synthetase
MAKTNPARGMRDFLPVDVRKREYVIGIIKQVYESYGYEPLETPAVENIDTLMGKYGEEGNQLVFKILKRGEKLDESLESGGRSELADLALRYDLTVPLARVVADRRNELPKFFKRYQIQPVWRADRPARGRFREFYQCDVDAIGSKSMVIEAEQIAAVCEILRQLGFSDFSIRINHRLLLEYLVDVSGVVKERRAEVIGLIDKLDKIGAEGLKSELASRNFSSETIETILSYLNWKQTATSNFQDRFRDAAAPGRAKVEINRRCAENELERLKAFVPEQYRRFVVEDYTLARGLSYYTGTIMEINVPDLAGSLGGGGRYDGLIGIFGKEPIPACGFSLGLERILFVMDERGMFPPEIAEWRAADVMVTIWNEETIAGSLKLADELRKQGLRVLVYPEVDKLGKQIKYADSIGVPFVCILGESEMAEDKVTLKNMRSGEQKTIEKDRVYMALKKVRSS